MKEYIDPKDLLKYIDRKLQERKIRMEAIDKSKTMTSTYEYNYMDAEVNQLLAMRKWVKQNTIRLR